MQAGIIRNACSSSNRCLLLVHRRIVHGLDQRGDLAAIDGHAFQTEVAGGHNPHEFVTGIDHRTATVSIPHGAIKNDRAGLDWLLGTFRIPLGCGDSVQLSQGARPQGPACGMSHKVERLSTLRSGRRDGERPRRSRKIADLDQRQVAGAIDGNDVSGRCIAASSEHTQVLVLEIDFAVIDQIPGGIEGGEKDRHILASLDNVCGRHDQPPIDVFTQAVENVKPNIEVRSKRVGGASYQVPMQVNRNRQQSLAIRWILGAVREKGGRASYEKLAAELLAAYNREGTAITKRENVHRMVDANKAFAHFAW